MRHEFNHSRRQAQRMGGIHRIIDDDLSMIIINISPYLELSLFHRSNPTRRAKQQIQFMSEKCTSKSGGGGLRKKHFAQLVTCQRDLWHRSSASKAATRMNLFYYSTTDISLWLFNEKNGHDFCKSQVPIPVYINKLAKRDIILMKNLIFRKLNNFSYLTMEKNE